MDVFEKITLAFRSLRKEGFIARQRFLCCGSCAGSAVATQVGEMPKARRDKVRGLVFYTRQDDGNAFDRRGHFTGLYLAYGQIHVHEVGDVGLPTVEVGQALVKALEAQGLKVEWDGSPDTKIWIPAEQGEVAA